MNSFTPEISPNNKHNFPDIYHDHVSSDIRKNIYEHIIANDENSYFCLDKLHDKYNHDKTKIDLIIKNIIKELTLLNWKCKLSFGGTALFIYSSEKPPPSCWDDGF